MAERERVQVRRAGLGALVLALLVGAAMPLHGQGIRGWTSSNFRFVELRPVVQDTAPRSEVTFDPDGTPRFQGRRVFCVPGGDCTFFRPLDQEYAVQGSQDLGFTAWGLGLQGLSFTGLVRGRARFDGDFVWPRSDDEFDAILAYAQLDRGDFRVKVGRQQSLSGLGFRGFDGGSVRWAPVLEFSAEAYGGRSLARALNQPRNEALQGLVDFLPDQDAWLIGGHVTGRFRGGTSVDLRYQREILDDRSGLVSERASLDLKTHFLRPVRISGSLDYDVAFDDIGKAHLTLEYATPSFPVVLEVTGRRYRPYFALTTVWGFFDPVAYHEVTGRVAWSDGTTTLWGEGGWRSYEETDAPVIFEPLEDDGWRAESGARWNPTEQWTVEGRYELTWGVGAFLSSGDVTARFRPSERFEVSAHGLSFQQFQEFRVGEGRAWGGGLGVGVGVTKRIRLNGGVSIFRHDPQGRLADERWDQLRGWSALRIEFGSEPGRPGRRFRR